jgi:hypothetical protein
MTIRKLMTSGAIAAFVGIGALAATSTAASAYTVCNRYNDCWHEDSRYDYPTTLGVHFSGDDWRLHHRDGYHWRDHHDGRGYWRNGLWVQF